VASIFYEGMVLQWFLFVGTSILLTDIFFLFSTIAGLFYYKNNKCLFYSHLISIFVICVGIVIMIIFGKDVPKWLFMLWEFYILYFYGYMVSRKLWNLIEKKLEEVQNARIQYRFKENGCSEI
jgi:hypothetical protein